MQSFLPLEFVRMRIALTGGSGFIGSHLLELAVEKNTCVTALRRGEKSNGYYVQGENITWVDSHFDKIGPNSLRGTDILVHLATHSGNPPYDSIIECFKQNVCLMLELFEQAYKSGIRYFIVAGSCFEYGNTNSLSLTSDSGLKPNSSYACSKAMASLLLEQWAEERCVDLTIVRLFHVFGEREFEKRLWPTLVRYALNGRDLPMTNGEQVREFTYVRDVARELLRRCHMIPDGTKGFRILNLGSKNGVTIREFADYWWKRLDAKGSLIYGAIPYRENELMRLVGGEEKVCLPDFRECSLTAKNIMSFARELRTTPY